MVAVVAIVDRHLVAPPKLTRDTPVPDVFQPMAVDLSKTVRNKVEVSLLVGFQGRLGQGFHLDKPLLGNQGFNNSLTALAMAYCIVVVIDFN